MSPLDEELHAALHGRAASLTPPPDPMAGIERRATGIRRRRIAASVAGGALVIAAAVAAVPTLLPKDKAARLSPATQAPTPVASNAALDPDHPWAMRGQLSDAALASFRAAWTARHPGSTLTPLFGQVYEPSAQPEAAFVATGTGGPRYGFVTQLGPQPAFLVDEALADGTTALAFALEGDEVPRLLVVASDRSREVDYAITAGAGFRDVTMAGTVGVGVTSLEGDLSTDRVRVIAEDGRVVYDEAAPEPSQVGFHPEAPNLLSSWPERGTASVGPPEADLTTKFATALGRADQADRVSYRALFTADTDSGVRYTVGQAWFIGEPAYNVSYATGGTNGPEFFLGKVTPKDPAVLAFLIGSLPGTSVDQLVVVPNPRTGQVSYDDDATGAFRPITGQDHLDGVVLIDRSKTASDDRLELLDGHGNMDAPTYRGPVAPLLCGIKECG